jgi:hypothetical protein
MDEPNMAQGDRAVNWGYKDSLISELSTAPITTDKIPSQGIDEILEQAHYI